MDPVLGGALVGAGAKLLGGIFQGITGNNSQNKEYQRQKEFAQNGITWRVADAERAGIHPLAALGASTTSYTPQSAYGTDFGLSDMGQSISDFASRYRTPKQRAHDDWVKRTGELLNIRNMELNNQEVESRIELNRMEASKMALNNQPGNPIGGVTNPFTGGNDSQHGDKAIQFQEFKPGYYKLQPGNDYSQFYEEFPILGSIPVHFQRYILGEGFHKGFLPPDRFERWGYFYDKQNDAFTLVGTPEYYQAKARWNALNKRKNVAKKLVKDYSIPTTKELASKSPQWARRLHIKE